MIVLAGSLFLPVAHGSHWIETVIILAPVTAVFVWLGAVRVRDRLRARAAGAQRPEAAPAVRGASDSTSGP